MLPPFQMYIQHQSTPGSTLSKAAELATLVPLPNVPKRCPSVVHAGGNALYEEPCMVVLALTLQARVIGSIKL